MHMGPIPPLFEIPNPPLNKRHSTLYTTGGMLESRFRIHMFAQTCKDGPSFH